MNARSVLPPRGLSRAEAAAYIGISPTKFDQLVRDGRMPPPKEVDRRKVWDRVAIDVAFTSLGDPRPWATRKFADSELGLSDWDLKQQ